MYCSIKILHLLLIVSIINLNIYQVRADNSTEATTKIPDKDSIFEKYFIEQIKHKVVIQRVQENCPDGVIVLGRCQPKD